MLTVENLGDLLSAPGIGKKGAIDHKAFVAAILEVNFTRPEAAR